MDYQTLKKDLKKAENKVNNIKEQITDEFINHIKETYPDDFKTLQDFIKDPIKKIVPCEYIGSRGEWCHTVCVETQETKEFAISMGNEWYEEEYKSEFICKYPDKIRIILKKFYDEFPFLINDYID
ncbi:MAG: hypothetical protein ACYDDE_00610 [bacterium]